MEVSDEVWEIAQDLYDDADIEVNRYGQVEGATFMEFDEYNEYYRDCSQEDFDKAVQYLNSLLTDDVKFYTDYNRYLELNDNHTLWDIDIPDGANFNDEDYSFMYTTALENLQDEIGVEVFGLGRSGRHICVEDNFRNLTQLDKFKEAQNKWEDWLVDTVEKSLKDDTVEEAKELAPDEKTAKCLSCGMKITYKNRDVQHDAMGDYIECPNCKSTFDVDYDNTPTKKTEDLSLSEEIDLAAEIEKYLTDNQLYPADVFVADTRVMVEIHWGDWKHDHLRCDALMKAKGYALVEEEVTEEDGSDTYSAIRHYIPTGSGKGLTEAVLDDNKKIEAKDMEKYYTDIQERFGACDKEKDIISVINKMGDKVLAKELYNKYKELKRNPLNLLDDLIEGLILYLYKKIDEDTDKEVKEESKKVESPTDDAVYSFLDQMDKYMNSKGTDGEALKGIETTADNLAQFRPEFADMRYGDIYRALSKEYKIESKLTKAQLNSLNKLCESKKTEAEDMTQVKDDIETAVEKSDSTDLEKDQVKGSLDVLKTDEESAISGYEEFNKETAEVVDDELADAVKDQMEEIIDDEKEHIEKIDTIKKSLGEFKQIKTESKYVVEYRVSDTGEVVKSEPFENFIDAMHYQGNILKKMKDKIDYCKYIDINDDKEVKEELFNNKVNLNINANDVASGNSLDLGGLGDVASMAGLFASEENLKESKYSDVYKYKGKAFSYNKDDAIVEYVWVDPDTNEWVVIDEIGLSNDNWEDRKLRDAYLDEYIRQLDDEANRLADDFIANEFLGESLNQKINRKLQESRGNFDRNELVAVKDSIDTALNDLQIQSDGTTGAMADKVLVNDLRSVSQSVGNYLDKILEGKDLKHPELNNSIKSYYAGAFESDELNNEIKDATFLDLYRALKDKQDVYDLIGVKDSVVRERLFAELARILNQPIEYVNNVWQYGVEDGQPNIVKEDKETGTIKQSLNTGVLPIVNVDLYGLYSSGWFDNLVLDDNSNAKFDEIIQDIAPRFIKETIQDVLPSVEIYATDVYHPKEYNFSGDELEFDLVVNADEYNALKEKALSSDMFETYLKDNYSSRSGFISSMPEDIDEFNRADEWKQMVQVIMFALKDTALTDVNEAYLNDFSDAVNQEFPYVDGEIENAVEELEAKAKNNEITLDVNTVTDYIKEQFGNTDSYDYILDEVLKQLNLTESVKVEEAKKDYSDWEDAEIVNDVIKNFKAITGRQIKSVLNYDGTEEIFKPDVIDVTGEKLIDYLSEHGLERSRVDDLLYKIDDALASEWDKNLPDNFEPIEEGKKEELFNTDVNVNVDAGDIASGNNLDLGGLGEIASAVGLMASEEDIKDGKEKLAEDDDNEIPVVNPDDRDYYNGKGYMISLYPGAGVGLVTFKVYCDDIEPAIEKAVAYAEQNGYNGLLLDIGEMNDRAKEDLAYAKAREKLPQEKLDKMVYGDIVAVGRQLVDDMEKNTPDDFYDAIDEMLSDLIYIDATTEGAKQCYYIYSEMQAEEFDDNTDIKTESTEYEANYEKGKAYLENIAKEDGAEYYEIVEDTYEYPNGLMLIEYDDEAHEIEKQHICIDLDNLDKDERFLGPSDETIADSKAKGLYSESADNYYDSEWKKDYAGKTIKFHCEDCGTDFEGKLNDNLTMPVCPHCLETRYADDDEKLVDGHANKDVHIIGPDGDPLADNGKSLYKEVKQADDIDLEKLANDIIDWYGNDIGTWCDDIKGQEEEVFDETLDVLERRDKETIASIIDDIEEDEDKEKTSSLVERLKALLK